MLRTALTAAAALTGFGIAIVDAQERAPVSWDITLENDRWGDGADRHYTHGTRLTRSSAATPRWIRKIAAPMRCLACTDPRGLELQFGQEIYTPENIWSSAVVANDRPYAGWAYGSVTLHGERDATRGRRKAVNALTFELGVIGPAALADRTQALLHRKRDFPAARGGKISSSTRSALWSPTPRNPQAARPRRLGGPPRHIAVLRRRPRQRVHAHRRGRPVANRPQSRELERRRSAGVVCRRQRTRRRAQRATRRQCEWRESLGGEGARSGTRCGGRRVPDPAF